MFTIALTVFSNRIHERGSERKAQTIDQRGFVGLLGGYVATITLFVAMAVLA